MKPIFDPYRRHVLQGMRAAALLTGGAMLLSACGKKTPKAAAVPAGATVLAENCPIGNVHQQTKNEGPTHTNTAKFAHAPETEDQCYPIWNACPVRSWQKVEEQGKEQAEKNEPRVNR